MSLAGCGGEATQTTGAVEDSIGGCGVERWSVKTGTDADAGKVNLTPQDTTISALRALALPATHPASNRLAPTETSIFRLTNVTLVEYKVESDGDYHLVLSDGANNTMIAEIPSPACVGGGSVFASGIAGARNAFNGKYKVTGSFQMANDVVTVTGAGFFDLLHGQTGVAPNGVELHAVLDICWGKDCAGGGGCTPNCGGKQCGSDGCGGTCGSCATGQTCSPTGQCGGGGNTCAHPICSTGAKLTGSCDPCATKVCAADSYCCSTSWDAQCVGEVGSVCNITCGSGCTPSCGGKQCGSDGCGGTCGSCPSGQTCSASGQCASGCTPSCGGKQCGSDGCGGSCGSCATGQSCNATGQCGSSGGALQTVFVVVMENHNWSSISGSSSAPYINNTLLPIASHANQYFNAAGIHPSEPNYLWMEAGTNFNILNDNLPSSNHQSTTQHLVTQLQNAGISWKSYQEGISGTSCPLTNSGLYAPKHNPMVFFDDVTKTTSNCVAHMRPYTELAADLTNNTVARYNFITPNLCDDMHNSSGCATSDSVANGDTWLANEVPKILNSAAYQSGGVLFITWDESEGGDFPIGMIALSPKAKGNGYSNTVSYTHGSLLRTVQEIFGVTPLLGDAANQSDLSDLFTSFP